MVDMDPFSMFDGSSCASNQDSSIDRYGSLNAPSVRRSRFLEDPGYDWLMGLSTRPSVRPGFASLWCMTPEIDSRTMALGALSCRDTAFVCSRSRWCWSRSLCVIRWAIHLGLDSMPTATHQPGTGDSFFLVLETVELAR